MEDNCVFCDRVKFEERLITEASEWYVIATLGQITGGYVLAVPKAHIPCVGAFSSSQIEVAVAMAHVIRRVLSLEYQQDATTITMFEHGIVGQTVKHAHLHLLPVAIDLTPRIRADFPDCEFEELPSIVHLRYRYAERQEPYLLWTASNSKPIVCWNPPAPPQYLRLVVADLLGRPERGNWRDMDPGLDKQLVQETIDCLKPYFS
jgi:diadenosine tetraphosphate (Ap4A) HIT family hydrolase